MPVYRVSEKVQKEISHLHNQQILGNLPLTLFCPNTAGLVTTSPVPRHHLHILLIPLPKKEFVDFLLENVPTKESVAISKWG